MSRRKFFTNPRKEIRQFFCEDQSYEISRLPPVARGDRRRIPNMAWFTPAEHPDEKYYIFGKEGGVRMAEKYGIQLLGQIPIVQSIRKCGDAGEPAALSSRPDGLAFLALAEKVAETLY